VAVAVAVAAAAAAAAEQNLDQTMPATWMRRKQARRPVSRLRSSLI